MRRYNDLSTSSAMEVLMGKSMFDFARSSSFDKVVRCHRVNNNDLLPCHCSPNEEQLEERQCIGFLNFMES